MQTTNKQIYFYWGNDSISYMRYMTLFSFCKLNPNWSVNLIQNNQLQDRFLTNTIVEKQDKTEYKGQDYSYLITDLEINIIDFENKMISLDEGVVSHMPDVHIKDILNWKILSDWGGVVADMDILFIKPMNGIINETSDIGLVCFDNYPQKNYIPVSFMYSSGNNKFFKHIYENSLEKYNPDVYESCGTLCIREENLEDISQNYHNLKIQKFEDTVVFPFAEYEWNRGIEMLYTKDNTHLLSPNSVGIHWYAGTPQSQRYNNLLNDINVHKINNTISVMIRRLL